MLKDYNQKNITELSLKELIEILLSKQKQPFQLKHHQLKTTLAFNIESIEYGMKDKNTKDVLPIMGIFSVFDILGSAFKLVGVSLPDSNNFKKCIKYFSPENIADIDIDALYALRNSLVHNSSLISIPKYNNQKHYYFRYDNNNNNKIVNHPTLEWDGNFTLLDSDSDKYITKVNTKKLLQLMYACIENIKLKSRENKIHLNYTNGKRELFYRYFRLIKNKLTDKEKEKLKEVTLSDKIKGKIESIIENTDSRFTIINLGENDKYSTSFKEKHIIFVHEDLLIVNEIKFILDFEFLGHSKYSRDLTLFYTRNIWPSKSYKIELGILE